MQMRQYHRHDDIPALHAFLSRNFAYMQGRIDPPSSMSQLSLSDLAAMAKDREIWVIDNSDSIAACLILTPQPDTLYLGKLAVDPTHRGQGLARRLIDWAETRAITLNLPSLTLEARVELLENHAAFAHLGFQITEETAHPGYDRATSYTMVKYIHQEHSS